LTGSIVPQLAASSLQIASGLSLSLFLRPRIPERFESLENSYETRCLLLHISGKDLEREGYSIPAQQKLLLPPKFRSATLGDNQSLERKISRKRIPSSRE
jgi:hypothetical protein